MTLLSIGQQVAQEVGLLVPSTFVGNGDETAARILALAQREGKTLSRRPYRGWSIMQTEHTFETVNGTAYYDLPSDMDYLIGETAWNRDQYWEVRGGLTPVEWQYWKSRGINAQRGRYRIKALSGALKFYLDPTPTAAEDIVFEYVSVNWCQSSGGTGQSSWTADTDTARIREDLIEMGLKWRVKQAIGLAYLDEKDEYEREVQRAIARDANAPRLDYARRPAGFQVNMPETGWYQT